MTADSLPYLSSEKLASLGIATAEVVACIEHLLLERKRSRAWSAPKPSIKTPDGRYLMATLSAAEDPSFMAVKALHLNPRNPERGLAAINSVVILHDGATGLPLAVLEGNWITAVRTAGLSVLAANRMAHATSAIAAFIGCGVEARSHLDAFAASFPLREVRAFGRGGASRDGLCRAAQG